jgi:hypothetical protein
MPMNLLLAMAKDKNIAWTFGVMKVRAAHYWHVSSLGWASKSSVVSVVSAVSQFADRKT